MNFKTTSTFDKDVKKLLKKYSLLKKDLVSFLDDFDKNHQTAVKIKTNLYKTRIKNSNKNKGKSAGYRVYYYLKLEDSIYLLTIYDKSTIEAIDENILIKIIENEVI